MTTKNGIEKNPTTLKKITDDFLEILENLYGLKCDTSLAFNSLQKELRKMKLDEASLITFANSIPNDPKARIQHCTTVGELISRIDKEGKNLIKIRGFILTEIIEHWEHNIRKQIASALGFKNKNEVRSNIMAEINRIRQDLLHGRGKAKRSASNRIIPFQKDTPIELNEIIFDLIFSEIFKYLNGLLEANNEPQYTNDSLNQREKIKHQIYSHTIRES